MNNVIYFDESVNRRIDESFFLPYQSMSEVKGPIGRSARSIKRTNLVIKYKNPKYLYRRFFG